MPFFKNRFLTLVFLLVLPATVAYGQKERIPELEAKLRKATQDTVRIRLLRELSVAHTSVDADKKRKYARDFGRLARKLEMDTIVVESYLDIGVSFGIQSQIDSAVHYFSRGEELAVRLNYAKGKARALACLGYAYDILDNPQQAILNYKEALSIYRELKILRGTNQCLTNIGSLYYDLEQYGQARIYFARVLESYRKAGDESGIAYAQYTLGNADQELGRYKTADSSYAESLRIRMKLGDITGIAMTNWGMAKLDVKRKQYDSAARHLEVALEHIRQIGDPYQESAILLTYSQVWLEQGKLDKAESYALRSLSLLRKVNNRSAVSITLRRLADVYEAKGNIPQAYHYQSEYIKVRDSIQEEEARRDIAQTEYSRIQSENDDLQKDNLDISSKNSGYFKTIVVVTAVLVFLTVLLVLYYRRNREVQRMNRILEEQKEEIASINSELEAQIGLTEAQNHELDKLNKVKNKFFSIVSHDLRSPMATLQMLFALYREGQIKEMDLHDTLVKLEDTIYSTNEFLDNLLEWAKNQLEGMTVKPERFGLHDLVDKNIRLIDSKIRLKNLRVTNTIEEGTLVFADPNMIDVVIRNLLSNSAKFCGNGDRITVSGRREGDVVRFAVSDTGPGIADAEKQRLFSLEHTVNVGTSGEKSHHIGLILCRDMVELNKGRIDVESEVGKGTSIWVTLPA